MGIRLGVGLGIGLGAGLGIRLGVGLSVGLGVGLHGRLSAGRVDHFPVGIEIVAPLGEGRAVGQVHVGDKLGRQVQRGAFGDAVVVVDEVVFSLVRKESVGLLPHAVDVVVVPVDAVLFLRLCPRQVGAIQRYPAGIPDPVVVQQGRFLAHGVVPRLPRALGRARQVGVVGQGQLGIAKLPHLPVDGIGAYEVVHHPVAVHVPENVHAVGVVNEGGRVQNAVLQDIPRQTIRVGLGAPRVKGHGLQHGGLSLARADHILRDGHSVHVGDGVQPVGADRNGGLQRLDGDPAVLLQGVLMLAPIQREGAPQGVGQHAVGHGGEDLPAVSRLQPRGHARQGDLHPRQSRGGGVHVGDRLLRPQTAPLGVGGVSLGGNAQREGIRDRQPLPADRKTPVNTRFAEIKLSLQHGQGHGNAQGASVLVGDRKGGDLLIRHGAIAYDDPLAVQNSRDGALLHGHDGKGDAGAGGGVQILPVDRGQSHRHGGQTRRKDPQLPRLHRGNGGIGGRPFQLEEGCLLAVGGDGGDQLVGLPDIQGRSAQRDRKGEGAGGDLHGLSEQPVVAQTALVRGARRLGLRRLLCQEPLLLDGPASVVVGGQIQILGGGLQRGLVVLQQAQIAAVFGGAEVAVDHAPLRDLFVVPHMLVSVVRAIQRHLIVDALGGQHVAALRRCDDVILSRHQLVCLREDLVGGDHLAVGQRLARDHLRQRVPSRRADEEGHLPVLYPFGGDGSLLQINDRHGAVGIVAGLQTNDRLGNALPFQALGMDRILDVTAVAHPIGRLCRTVHGRESQTHDRHAPLRDRSQPTEGQYAGGAVLRQIGGVGRLFVVSVLGCAVRAGRLQGMGALTAVALDPHLILGDGEDRHGQGSVRARAQLIVIAHVACVHVGEGQRLGGILGAAALGDEDGIPRLQIDGGAAQIIVPAVGMVMAEEEDDVQTRLARLVQHVEEVARVLSVPVGVGSHGVVKGEMGQNEHGAVVALLQLAVQIGLQTGGGAADMPLVAVEPHVVHFMDDEHAVAVGVVGAAFRQRRSHHSVGIVVSLHVDLPQILAEGLLRVVAQSRQTRRGHFGAVHVAAGVVAQKQKTVGIRIARVLYGLYDPAHRVNSQRGILVEGLEVGSRQQVDRVLSVKDRLKSLGYSPRRKHPDRYEKRQRKRQQLYSVRFQIHSPLISVDPDPSPSLYTTRPASVKGEKRTSGGKDEKIRCPRLDKPPEFCYNLL